MTEDQTTSAKKKRKSKRKIQKLLKNGKSKLGLAEIGIKCRNLNENLLSLQD